MRETDTPLACNWKPASTTVKDGSGNQITQTVYEYDNYTTSSISPSGAIQHDSNFGAGYTARCNVTAIEHWRNTDGKMLTTTMQYDDAGNVVSSLDPLRNITTTTSYADVWNDNTCAPTTGNAAAYPTEVKVQASAGTLITTHTYNSCTGSLASTTDANSQETTFTYDRMVRNITADFPDGGSISTCFSEISGNSCYSGSYPLSVASSQTINSSGLKKVATKVLDGLSRVSESQLNSDPYCNSVTGLKVDTRYDADGHTQSVSNPYCNTTDPTYVFTTSTYDALDRVTALTHPDNSSVNTQYDIATGIANCKRVTDESGRVRKLCSDAAGRMTSVFEDPSGLGYETDYQYNAVDNLLRVDQKGGSSTSSQWHTRQFSYDSLSHLTQATNPETGTVCYGLVSGSTCQYGYDDDGNLQSKTDARGIATNYHYDTLNRLVGKTYANDTTSTVSSCYQYGTSAGAGNQNGRLVAEWTLPAGTSCPAAAPTSGFLTMRTQIQYEQMGRLKSEQQCTPANCGQTNYSLQYTYDYAGNLVTSADNLALTPYTLTYGYDGADHLRSVNSSWPADSTHPGTLFSAQPWQPFGMTNAALGANIQLTRVYDSNRGFLTQETDQGNIRGAATSGSGSATISFGEQSVGTPTDATGFVTISGTEQSIAATASTGSISIAGTEQSKTIAGTSGSGSFTINGSEQSTTIQVGCGPYGQMCPQTQYDGGSVVVTINGTQYSAGYGQGCTNSCIASSLASSINSGPDTNATLSGSTVYLTARATGAATNYTLSGTSSTGQPQYFSQPSFTVGTSGSTLTGGANAYNIYDSGTASATVNGCTGSYNWGQSDSTSTIASGLASSLGSVCGSSVSASASGATVSLTSKSTGSSTNWTISTGMTYNTGQFSSSSFSASSSGMSGGKDAIYDGGTVTITVNGHSDSASFGQNDTASTIASNLAAAIQGDGAASVTAAASGSTVNLTTKTAGSGVNYSLGASDTYNSTSFSHSSFAPSPSGSTLTGGTAGGGTPIYDSGTVTMTVNASPVFSKTVSYGSSDTASTIASKLASAYSGDSTSPVNVTASSATLSVTAKSTGASTNYGYSFSSTYNTSQFSSPSFQGPSSGALSGGLDYTLTAGQIYAYTLGYELNGNLKSNNDTVIGNWNYYTSTGSGYDSLNRLKNAVATSGPCSGMNLTWGYDAWGNRQSQAASGSSGCSIVQPSYTFSTGNNNRIDGWSYDAAGHLLSDANGNTLKYDAEGRIASVTSGSGTTTLYVYDAEGTRVAKENASGAITASYVLGPTGDQVTEMNGSGQWVHSSLFAGSRLIGTYDANGTHFHLEDALSTRRAQVRTDGSVDLTCFSYPFGDGLSCAGGGGDNTDYHFTQHLRDAESGDDYFGLRYYSSNMGRFLTADSVANDTHASNPQSWNLYAYARNNPTTLIDPNGGYASPGSTTSGDNNLQLSYELRALAGELDAEGEMDRGMSMYLDQISGPMNTMAPEAKGPQRPGFWGKLGQVINNGIHLRGLHTNEYLDQHVGRGTMTIVGVFGMLPPMSDGARMAARQATRSIPRTSPPPTLREVAGPDPVDELNLVEPGEIPPIEPGAPIMQKLGIAALNLGKGLGELVGNTLSDVMVCIAGCQMNSAERALYGPPPQD